MEQNSRFRVGQKMRFTLHELIFNHCYSNAKIFIQYSIRKHGNFKPHFFEAEIGSSQSQQQTSENLTKFGNKYHRKTFLLREILPCRFDLLYICKKPFFSNIDV